MYDPVTSTTVAKVAATVVSVAGAIQQGKQQKKMAEYNAAVAEQNAIAAKNKAKYDEQIHRDRVKRLLSEQRAIIGASGVDLSGSPLLAMIDTVEKGELDALAIRHSGEVEARKFKSKAALSKMEGKAAMTTARTRAGATLLAGGASAYKTYRGIA